MNNAQGARFVGIKVKMNASKEPPKDREDPSRVIRIEDAPGNECRNSNAAQKIERIQPSIKGPPGSPD